MQYGVGGGLCYLLLKLILDFLNTYRLQQQAPKTHDSRFVTREEWDKFLLLFNEHHREDKELLKTISSLDRAIRDQTTTFIKITAVIEAQQNMLNQIALDIRSTRGFAWPPHS